MKRKKKQTNTNKQGYIKRREGEQAKQDMTFAVLKYNKQNYAKMQNTTKEWFKRRKCLMNQSANQM